MHRDGLYPIGDVARRTGLSVSAIRFYSDEGIVRPAGLNTAGHRQYDLRAIALLELIRTLRDLGTGLDDIRRHLDGETPLRDLLAEHLRLVERQERDLRARRAVLRALNKQDGTAARAALMHKLVNMSDEERERLVDDFWTEVGADLPADFVERLASMRPRLPDDPTAAQLEAWIELADLVGDPAFRADVRGYFRDTFTTPPGPQMTAGPVQDFIHTTGSRTMEEIVAAHRCGLPPDSAHAQELVARFAREAGEAVGVPITAELRERIAAGFQVVDETYADALDDPWYDATHGRYLALVGTVNGTAAEPHDPFGPGDLGHLGAWIAAALRAPVAGVVGGG
ncbi:MerR family transcriptional regulator [Pseudonocardia lacus]|uniref:helix-turn-helix domain-containing protein n=1 Tax=Pseudonocardia lacus TaxID=2835865 RepID=UPI001BDC6B26|nr:MerR family transcriptional regulator [Pseudonocardia lacus]